MQEDQPDPHRGELMTKERPSSRQDEKLTGREAFAKRPEDEEREGETDQHHKDRPVSPILKVVLIIAALLVLAAGFAYGIYWWTRGSYLQSTNDAYLQTDQVEVAPRVEGYVEAVLVGDNQDVKTGQVLVRIASRSYVARADEDRAQIQQAEASAAEAEAQSRQQQAQIAQSLAQLAQSRAQERQYEAANQFDGSQARRYRPLAAAGAETSEKLAQYTSTARQSQAQLEAARAQAAADAAKVDYARRQIDIYAAQKRSALAKVTQAQAQLAADQVDLDAATIVSSVDGRVGDRSVRVGQYIQPGTRMMTIVPVGTLYLKANFKETQVGLMRIGQPARITVDALSGVVLHGVVESFSPGTGAQFSLIPTDNATGNFTKITQRVPVRIRIDAGPEARKVLVPGLSVTAVVDTIGAKADLKAEEDESAAGHDTAAGNG